MDTEVEDFLEHYGVKGMKWGVRKSRRYSPGSPGALSRERKITNARRRIEKGKNRERYQDAKTTYRHEKVTKGKAYAKNKFNKAKLKNLRDAQVANAAKDGKEFAKFLLVDIASGGAVTSANFGINAAAKYYEKKGQRYEKKKAKVSRT